MNRAALGRLEIDDAVHGFGHIVERLRSIRFEQHGFAKVEQTLHQRAGFGVLAHGFTACDFDEITVVCLDFGEDFVDRHVAPFAIGVCRIAPPASQIAPRQPHKDTRLSGETRFTLYGIEDFVNFHTRTSAMALTRDSSTGFRQLPSIFIEVPTMRPSV